jgi:hypothetical protein
MNLHVVLEDAALGCVEGVLGKSVVPGQRISSVVGTVDVVVVKHGFLVVGARARAGLRLGLRLRLRARLRLGFGFRFGLRLRLRLDRGRLGSRGRGRRRRSGGRGGRGRRRRGRGRRGLDHDGLNLLNGRSGLLDEDTGILLASGHGDSDHLNDPFSFQGTLVERHADGPSKSHGGACNAEEERGLHFDKVT